MNLPKENFNNDDSKLENNPVQKQKVEDIERNVSEQIEEIIKESKKVEQLLSSEDLEEEEKQAFTSELLAIKQESLSLRDKILGKVVQIRSEVSHALFASAERKKGVKVVNFIFDNLSFDSEEKLKKEWESQRNNPHIFLPEPLFSLNSESLKILKFTLREPVTSLFDLEQGIEAANSIHQLMAKGISLEMLKKLRISKGDNKSAFSRLLRSNEEINKFLILQGTDFIDSGETIDVYSIDQIPFDQFKLLEGKNGLSFTWKNSNYFNFKDLSDGLTEKNILSFNDFTGESSTISVSEFVYFTRTIAGLPEDIKKIFQNEYKKGKKIGDMIYGMEDFLKNLDDSKAAIIIKLLDSGLVSSLNSHDLKYLVKFDMRLFDRCEHLGLSIKDLSKDDLELLNNIPDEGIEIFELITKEYKGSVGSMLEETQNIYSTLGLEDGLLFVEWTKKSNQAQNFEYFANDVFQLGLLKDIFSLAKNEKDINLFDFVSQAYGKDALGEREDMDKLSTSVDTLNNKPEVVIPDILNSSEGIANTFINFENVKNLLAKKNIEFTQEYSDTLFEKVLYTNPSVFLKKNSFPFTLEQRTQVLNVLIDQKPIQTIKNFVIFEREYLSSSDNIQSSLDILFKNSLKVEPLVLLSCKEFPFTPEQTQYLNILKRIDESYSRELKNLASEIAPLVAKFKTFEEATEALDKIEQIFLTNNIPLVGKQYKVFQILYPDQRLAGAISKSRVDSLKSLPNSSEQRLVIFKDLMRAHLASSDSNLERYLLTLKEGSEILSVFESGKVLDDSEKATLKLFLKKINTLTGHTGRKNIVVEKDMSDQQMKSEIEALDKAFGVRQNETLIQKFERTFLHRVGIDSVDDALKTMNEYRTEASVRNEESVRSGVVEVKKGDFVKNISSNYLDSYLDRGVYAPEFIGAESNNSKQISVSSDGTPLDTDISRVEEEKSMSEMFNSDYGDIMLILKQKNQFKKDGLDVFKTGVINDRHYGIRTGFGSTEIDAMHIDEKLVGHKRFDQIKYFIARKGFYIPICDAEGKVTFTKEDFEEYRNIFSGINRFHGGDIEVSNDWKSGKSASEIKSAAQTTKNIEKIIDIKEGLITKIREILEDQKIALHEGKYDDSLKGAVISDTGSTGRGSSLDGKLDFDFVVKLDDADWDKVSKITAGLGKVFPHAEGYDNQGMIMYRSSEITIDGVTMTIDIGFSKKSDAEDFDAHDALNEKYDSIKKMSGEDTYIDVLTNIRFAKKKLKEAECYKKGVGSNGQQGGLGGIGVEYWILQNGGDAVLAFKSFADHAFKDGSLVPLDEFRKKYKVFSAGQNIRGAEKVENFTWNMSETGYVKMANLAKQIST